MVRGVLRSRLARGPALYEMRQHHPLTGPAFVLPEGSPPRGLQAGVGLQAMQRRLLMLHAHLVHASYLWPRA